MTAANLQLLESNPCPAAALFEAALGLLERAVDPVQQRGDSARIRISVVQGGRQQRPSDRSRVRMRAIREAAYGGAPLVPLLMCFALAGVYLGAGVVMLRFFLDAARKHATLSLA